MTSSAARRKVTLFALKAVITFGCLALVIRYIDVATLNRLIAEVNVWLVLLAVFLIAIEVVLVGERWRLIIESLGGGMYPVSRSQIQAINGIGQFFSQVLPSIAGDGSRAILLRSQGGVPLAHATWTVLLDRAVGSYVLFIIGFAALLLPSGLQALAGYGQTVVVPMAGLIAVGTLGLLLSNPIGMRLQDVNAMRFIGTALMETHVALLGTNRKAIFGLSAAVHLLTILTVYILAGAIGRPLPILDSAVLMACMMVVTLLPISVGGWGVREVAVIGLLSSHGGTPEEAFLLSAVFGLVVMAGTIPGALYWLSNGNSESN